MLKNHCILELLCNARQQLEPTTSQLLWCSSFLSYLDPFSKPQAGTLHLLRCCIKARCFPATQQDLTDQASVHAVAFIRALWCLDVCVSVSTSLYVGVVEAEESVQAHVSSASSCVPLLHSEQTPLVGFAGALQIVPRCFPGCLWIWGTLRRKPRFLFSPFWTILMNNCDLTRKCKQVDRSESGQENIYCCQWNVKNAVLMEQARWCQPLHLSHEKSENEGQALQYRRICNDTWNLEIWEDRYFSNMLLLCHSISN